MKTLHAFIKKKKKKKILSDFDWFKVLNGLTATAFSFYLHFSVSWAFGKLVYNCFDNSFVKLRASLLCDFIMNPLVCQPDDGPPAKKKQCTSNRPYKLYFKIVCHERSPQKAHHSISLVSLVKTHASSKNIIAAWQENKLKFRSSFRNSGNINVLILLMWGCQNSPRCRDIHTAHSQTGFLSCEINER